MRISYSILWFDDTEEFFESLDLEPLQESIDSWGFNSKVTLVTNPDNFMSHQPFREFDLIVVDYNLEEYDKHGEEFIKKIRDHNVYTEVVFYSANPVAELWEAVKSKELEGVFISSRPGVLIKIERVAQQSVRKMLDLENVRGIVMAEVGNIDFQLDEIINTAFSKLQNTEQVTVSNKYKARITGQHQTNIDRVESLEVVGSMVSLLPFCDSNKKWNLFRSIGKKHPDIDLSLFGDYVIDILKPRNFLAHGTPEKQDDGSFLFTHRGESFEFNDNASAELRNYLKSYSEQFNGVLELVKNGE